MPLKTEYSGYCHGRDNILGSALSLQRHPTPSSCSSRTRRFGSYRGYRFTKGAGGHITRRLRARIISKSGGLTCTSTLPPLHFVHSLSLSTTYPIAWSLLKTNDAGRGRTQEPGLGPGHHTLSLVDSHGRMDSVPPPPRTSSPSGSPWMPIHRRQTRRHREGQRRARGGQREQPEQCHLEGHLPSKTLADAMEAMFEAVFLNSDMKFSEACDPLSDSSPGRRRSSNLQTARSTWSAA
ncbi:MAG: hypothetical protein J3Q66DRAFT_172884 [Benniella sp.]|nr:MAG: hypothetical protein J3Q66DRAFT_172884 [Benniella sp.]